MSATAKRLTVQQKQVIFHALVTAQDSRTMTIADSKRQVADQYAISDDQLEAIVEEGVDKDWPPLGEPAAKK
jgi:hypothetical protein